jgi:DNA-binding transcriptional regulator YiaG
MKAARKKRMWSPDHIRALRKAYGESQEQFCLRLGVAVGTLRDWEQSRGVPLMPVQLLLSRLQEDQAEGKIRPVPSLVSA